MQIDESITKAELFALVKSLLAENLALRNEVAALKNRVAELKRQAGTDSSTSSKPSSSDGLKKKPRIVAPGKSGRPSGGQKGHPGAHLRRKEIPDAVEDHLPGVCAGCGAALTAADDLGAVEIRQVLDLPSSLPFLATDHRVHACGCSACGKATRGVFPDGVSAAVQYGTNLESLVVLLCTVHAVAEDRLADLLRAMFGLEISPATIGSMLRRREAALAPAADAIEEAAKAAPVRGMDETGIRIGGKTLWLHLVATTFLTAYFPKERRGDIPAVSGGTVVHDHFSPYRTRLSGVAHALCGAHLLRELLAAETLDKEAWAGRMRLCLIRSCHEANEAKRRDGTAVEPGLAEALRQEYDRIVAEGIAFHAVLPPFARPGKRGRTAKRPGHNLVVRLRDFRSDVLRFLEDPDVPFSNNLAEQAARKPKTKLKVSGGFRSMDGAKVHARLLSIVETARKHGVAILDALRSEPLALLRTFRLV